MKTKKEMSVKERLRKIKAIDKQLFDESGECRRGLGSSKREALSKKQAALMKPIAQAIEGLAEMGRIQLFIGSSAEIRKWLKDEPKVEPVFREAFAALGVETHPEKRWRCLDVKAVNLFVNAFNDAVIRIDSHIAKEAGKGTGKVR